MHLTEANMISCRSEYFLYSATPKMRNCMYYPHRIGLGAFTPGYRLSRAPMNNFLIAYISEGSFHIRFADVAAVAHEANSLSSIAMNRITSPLMNLPRYLAPL